MKVGCEQPVKDIHRLGTSKKLLGVKHERHRVINGGLKLLCWIASYVRKSQSIEKEHATVVSRAIRAKWAVKVMDVYVSIHVILRHLFTVEFFQCVSLLCLRCNVQVYKRRADASTDFLDGM